MRIMTGIRRGRGDYWRNTRLAWRQDAMKLHSHESIYRGHAHV